MHVTFPYTIHMRKQGELKNVVICDVSVEEHRALREAAEKFELFMQCEELTDLYDRIFWAACEHATQYAKIYSADFDETIRACMGSSTWDISEHYPLSVDFPKFL